ncbi:flagellar biosynthesis protein FlhB [Alicyclobacillus sacchari]|nr:flagellar biosynthesis protein FlhB [Alicyclobacillus sacchari]
MQLQRFAGERTERATPRRREDARKEGRVARSPELTSAIALAALLIALRVVGPMVWGQWENIFQLDFSTPPPNVWTTNTVAQLLVMQMMSALKALAPIVGTGLIIGVAVAVMQVRPMFTMRQLVPDFSRIVPTTGLQRLFSSSSLFELGKSLAKLAIVGVLSYSSVSRMAAEIRGYGDTDVTSVPGVVGSLVFQLGIRMTIAMVLLAALDFMYQRYAFEKSLRMTKQEVKDEWKDAEGNPQIKSTIRKRARQMAMRRMMQAVPKADVVVTNPTHFAIALRYDGTTMTAPEVVAKGADSLAQRMKIIAAESGVPMVENKPLAQSLYRMVDIGEQVPAELYQAVAEVLAYVYRMRAGRRR